jgi:F-type H+-transporting ATPase subunit delta
LKPTTIARNYAEALFAAAEASDRVAPYGDLIDAVAGAIATDPRIAIVLESPRVAKTVKSRILADALEKQAPREFVRFLQAVVRRGRQGLFGEIAREYQGLMDVKLNRVHAGVTLAQEPDAKLRDDIVQRLTEALGKDVRGRFRADPTILGGVVVRVGDRIYDGSLRRRLQTLRRRMLTGA